MGGSRRKKSGLGKEVLGCQLEGMVVHAGGLSPGYKYHVPPGANGSETDHFPQTTPQFVSYHRIPDAFTHQKREPVPVQVVGQNLQHQEPVRAYAPLPVYDRKTFATG